MLLTDVNELHYICHIETVPSVLHHGILSHHAAAHIPHISVASVKIQAIRKNVIVPGRGPLHGFANLYFNGRNAMMYLLVNEEGLAPYLCILRVASTVVDLPNAVIADCNAASGYARFAPSPSGLSLLNKDEVFAASWNHPNYYDKVRHKSRMCAELLVPDRITPSSVTGAYVGTETAQAKLAMLSPGLAIDLDRRKFFQ